MLGGCGSWEDWHGSVMDFAGNAEGVVDAGFVQVENEGVYSGC